MYHGEEYIKKAEERYKTVANGGIPSNIESIKINKKTIEVGITLIELLVISNIAPSKSEARRLIEQNGISINQQKINDVKKKIDINDFTNNELTIQKGKKQFKKIVLK